MKENEYRMQSMFYEGDLHYHIEQFRKGKWRLIAGGFSHDEAKFLIDNNQGDYVKTRINFAGIVALTTLIVCVLGIILGNIFLK